MAESTLTLTYTQLDTAVARKLGWPLSTDGDRTTPQTTRIGEILDSGYRTFCFPPWREAGLPSHQWSFLKYDTTLELTASSGTTDCPDDFAYIVAARLFYTDSDDSQGHGIQVTTTDHIHRLLQEDDDYEEKPDWVAFRPKSFTAATGQRSEALFYPIPDDAYVITLPHVALPDASSGSNYMQGGMQHVETLKAACRAVAEHEEEDHRGHEWARFMSCLIASFDVDARVSPGNYGNWGDHDSRTLPKSRGHGIVHGPGITTSYS